MCGEGYVEITAKNKHTLRAVLLPSWHSIMMKSIHVSHSQTLYQTAMLGRKGLGT